MKGYASPPPFIPSSMGKLNNPCFWQAQAWLKAGIVAFDKEIYKTVKTRLWAVFRWVNRKLFYKIRLINKNTEI